ncbi:MAG: phage tail protein [Anaerolineaceae bacterium]|nr:phage tail protein [Anaerolineaceae bacterium]
MPVGNRKDPYNAYSFRVEISGIVRAGFRECSGLDATTDPIEYREGTDIGPVGRNTPRKLPGMVKFSNITLKWGISDDKDLWEWRKKIMQGTTERRDGSIILIDNTGEEKARWNFFAGWPSKWTGPSFNATGNEVAIETLELAHEGLVRA